MNLHQLADISRLASEVSSILNTARTGGVVAKSIAAIQIACLLVEYANDNSSNEFVSRLAKWQNRSGNLAVELDADGKWRVVREEYESDYVGDPDPIAIARELRSEGKLNATIAIVGSTGSGKSTLARKIGKDLHPDGRQIRLPGDIFQQGWATKGIRALHETLRPAVIIFDDVAPDGAHSRPDKRGFQNRMLEVLTYLQRKCTVVLTVMEDTEGFARDVRKGTIGAAYYSGLRPGRVDRFVLLAPPTEEQIRTILLHYGVNTPSADFVQQLEGLSGAYIAEAARVYQTHPENWRERIRVLRMTSPKTTPFDQTRIGVSLWARINKIESALKIKPDFLVIDEDGEEHYGEVEP